MLLSRINSNVCSFIHPTRIVIVTALNASYGKLRLHVSESEKRWPGNRNVNETKAILFIISANRNVVFYGTIWFLSISWNQNIRSLLADGLPGTACYKFQKQSSFLFCEIFAQNIPQPADDPMRVVESPEVLRVSSQVLHVEWVRVARNQTLEFNHRE